MTTNRLPSGILSSLAIAITVVACSQPAKDPGTAGNKGEPIVLDELRGKDTRSDVTAEYKRKANLANKVEKQVSQREESSKAADGGARRAGRVGARTDALKSQAYGKGPGLRFTPFPAKPAKTPPVSGFTRKMQKRRSKNSVADSRPAEKANRDAYDSITENDFLRTSADPLSTFSIDVDTASYSNIRRFLKSGTIPPTGAVRIEELLNYFEYDYPTPTGDVPFSTFVEAGACPWNAEHRLVHIGLRGKTIAAEEIPPRNLVFLLDVSGSMSSHDKLPLLKSAMEILVQQLNEEDSVAIVVYAGASGLVLPATHGDDKQRIFQALRDLRSGGSTNGGAGIRLAYRTARENFRKDAINRVILATDGDFNVGTTSRSELIKLIEKEREDGVFLTVLGLGRGNLQDATMEQLANKGNGNYAYLDSIDEAKKVLGQQVGGTLITIAKDVKIQVEFNPRLVKAYRLIGYENRKMAAQDFANDKKDAGEIGAGHSVTALYEIVPVGAKTKLADAPKLNYQTPSKLSIAADSRELMTLRLRYKQPTGSKSQLITQGIVDPGAHAKTTREFDFAAGVAMFGMLLRESKFKGSSNYTLASELAQGGLGNDPHGYRKEFLELVNRASQITTTPTGSR
jgi:Ca-activated chloride channel family protein